MIDAGHLSDSTKAPLDLWAEAYKYQDHFCGLEQSEILGADLAGALPF